jgi:hypothetical protein
MSDTDDEDGGEATHHDPAAPHTGPLPTHVPRWLAWILLIAFAAAGAVCTRAVIG